MPPDKVGRPPDEELNRGTLAAICSPLLALTALDLLILTFSYVGPMKWLHWNRLTMYGHLLFAGVTFWATIIAARLGPRAPVVGLSSLLLTFIVITRFRGPWVWQGTFDYYQQSKGPWLWPSAAGIALALTFLLLSPKWRQLHATPPADLPYILALAGCATLSLFASAVWRFDSMFAPSLHLALGACALVLAGVWAVVIRQEDMR